MAQTFCLFTATRRCPPILSFIKIQIFVIFCIFFWSLTAIYWLWCTCNMLQTINFLCNAAADMAEKKSQFTNNRCNCKSNQFGLVNKNKKHSNNNNQHNNSFWAFRLTCFWQLLPSYVCCVVVKIILFCCCCIFFICSYAIIFPFVANQC